MPKTLNDIVKESTQKVGDFFVNNWKKILTAGLITAGLTFVGTKALASEYNPSQPQEPTRAGQVMMPETIRIVEELIGDTNSGFEFPENEMDWVKNDSNVGDRGFINLHSKMWPDHDLPPFKGEYSAEMKLFNSSPDSLEGYFEIDLSQENKELGQADSLVHAFFPGHYFKSSFFNYTISIMGRKNSIVDTMTFFCGEKKENTAHHFFSELVNKDTLESKKWYKKNLDSQLKNLISQYSLEGDTLQKLRFCIFCGPVSNMSVYIGLDEVYLWTHYDSIVAISEPTQRTSELTDILLGNSNLYQANFPERGTLTIYDGKTGQRVRESINVYGNTELNFSDLSAGVYFGIYKPVNGRHQTQKIIKIK